ncbi:hypothetical protein SUDANB180_07553 [Streptomyces sp. enrichment culture]
MTRAGTDDFPAGLDHWTAHDWADYRARIEDGRSADVLDGRVTASLVVTAVVRRTPRQPNLLRVQLRARPLVQLPVRSAGAVRAVCAGRTVCSVSYCFDRVLPSRAGTAVL